MSTDAASGTRPAAAPTLARSVPADYIPVRHWGRWLFAAVLLGVIAALVPVFVGAQIDYGAIPGFFSAHTVLIGVVNAVRLAAAAMALAIAIGVVVALMRNSSNGVARTVAWLYIWLFRSAPALLQIYLWFNLALVIKHISVPIPFTHHYLVNDSTNHLITPFIAALLGLGLNESGYMAEIIRSGIQGVNRGQYEAATALGMPTYKVYTRVIFPQALRTIIPPTGNDSINMLKETSLAGTISYMELITASQRMASQNLLVMEALIAATIWYIILVSLASIVQYGVERHFGDRSGIRTPRRFHVVLRTNLRLPYRRWRLGARS